MRKAITLSSFLFSATLFYTAHTALAADHVIETDYFVFTMKGADTWGTVGYGDASVDQVIAQTTEVLNYWGDLLGSAHKPKNAEQKVTVSFNFENMLIEGTQEADKHVIGHASPETLIYTAGSNFYPFTASTTSKNFNTLSAAEAKLLARDLVSDYGNEAKADIDITFNSNFNFFFGTEAELATAVVAGATVVDFNTILLHEMAHGIGFFSAMIYSAQNSEGWAKNSLTYIDSGAPVLDADGKPVYSISNWDAMMNIDPDTFAPGETITLGEGLDLEVFNPSIWEAGSSMSHISEESDKNAVMNKSISNGVAYREFSEKELALYEQMGWSLFQVVPEPSSASLSLLALAALMRRRRRPVA